MGDVMGDVATFVTFRAAGSTLRETLSPARWRGTPSWAGSPESREEPNDRLEATPPSKMAIARKGTKEPRWPGEPWWDGRPSGTPVLRGCGGGLVAEAYSRASAGVKQNNGGRR
jgi:hypothetical protein